MITAKQIKESVRLADAMNLYGVQINRMGFCLCPFHNEKTASMRVYADDTYHCFGCGAHGDVIDFVRQNFGLTFRQAIDKLAADFMLTGESNAIAIKTAREAFLRRKERERTQKELKALTDEFRAAVAWMRVTETATEIAAQYQKPDDDFSDGFAIVLRDRERSRRRADDALNALLAHGLANM